MSYDYPAFDGTQNCTGVDTETFFVDDARVAQARNNDAKKVCEGCPFLTPCYRYALTHAVYGVWGGTTGYERDAIRKQRGLVPIPLQFGKGTRDWAAHGTAAGYRAHHRAGERACEPCRAAEARRHAGYQGRAS